MTATKEEFFNRAKLSAQDKATMTDQTARSIIAAEASAREKKTNRLRELRLQQEPAEETKPAATRAKRKPARKAG
ncbi:MAG: hypothetical protein QHC90_12005 [Shinella sp.]|nr:hypothetical protein [Shinella sp.]